MNVSLYVAFTLATVLLIVVPGPTVILVTATSLSRGTRAGLIAVAGSTSAAALQLAVVVAGFASIVTLAGSSFEWIRWAGVVYLIYLGIRAWTGAGSRASAETPAVASSRARRDFARGFVVTLTNPKTLLFLGAFLPQFVDPDLPRLPQLLILAASFLGIAGVLDSVWALAAGRVGTLLESPRSKRLIDRLAGTVLLCAGVALAEARRAQ